MTAVKSGLMIIDQHRAHMRILYDGYMRQQEKMAGAAQKMLFPEMVQFPPSDVVVLERVMPELERLGFELTSLGGGSFAINSVPSGIEGVNVVNLVRSMVESAVELDAAQHDEICHGLALCLARQAAIPHGQILSNEEMENIVNQLFACSNVNYAPDGKAVLAILPQMEIEKLLD